MSETAIRTKIYTVVNGVANIGKVYDYERWAADWNTFIGFFKTTISGVAQIRGWDISRRSGKSGKRAGSTEKSHLFVIRGYMGLNDANATEKTFNALIEAIEDEFRTAANWNLGGVCESHDYIQADVIEPRMFGSVLCHYAELTLNVTETI